MRAAFGFRCRRCGWSRPTFLIGRKGDGKRADRIYQARICQTCVEYLVHRTVAGTFDVEWIGRWDGRTLRRIAAL